MSNNTKIFSEAIAEAKAIRETAMVNAKLALEEAFAPRIQEMMSDKLEALAEEDEIEEGFGQEETQNEEISLEELLAELDGLEETAVAESDDQVNETADKDADDKMEENTIAEEAGEDDAVGEITVDELRDIIKDVMASIMGGGEEGEMEAGEEGEMEAGEEAGAEDELELDEILAEISSIEENEELSEGDLDEALDQEIKALASKYGKSFEKWIDKVGDKLHGGAGWGLNKPGGQGPNEGAELEEAMETIATLRSEINEVNLLNAKLLYVNKLFKAKNLTESQKVKVINAFDRAESVKEAKNVYETLQESLSTAAKSQIKESLSFASKAAGVADRQPIVESNDFVARMQKLAGII
jgi:hypothetical protein